MGIIEPKNVTYYKVECDCCSHLKEVSLDTNKSYNFEKELREEGWILCEGMWYCASSCALDVFDLSFLNDVFKGFSWEDNSGQMFTHINAKWYVVETSALNPELERYVDVSYDYEVPIDFYKFFREAWDKHNKKPAKKATKKKAAKKGKK